MTIRLLLAPAGRGKTRHAVERIRAVLAAEPLAPVVVLLPNRIRVNEFRGRLAAAGGALGADLLTFHMLYAALLARAGQPLSRLSPGVEVHLLRALVDRLADQGGLRHYAPLRAKPGFVAALRDTVQELKRARIEPERFARAVAGGGPRLEELAALYRAYQDWLQEQGWADAEGQGWLAAVALERNPALGRDIRLLVVNGFDEFNPTQLGVLVQLARRAQETLITLTGDTARPRLAHRRFIRAREMLCARLEIEPEPLAGGPPGPQSALQALEAGLFENPQSAIPNPQSVEFVEAQNRAEEARAALRWLKARVVRDGMAPDELAVLARDLEAYRPFLEEVAAEFGLPLRVAGGLPLADNPAIASLMSLLLLPALDWPRRPVLEAWRSPYFDWSAQGITADDAAALDTVTQIGRVIEGRGQWGEAFERAARQAVPDATTADEPDLGAAFSGVDATRLREKFDAFVARLMPPEPATISEHVAWVEDLIGDDLPLARHSRHAPQSLSVTGAVRENSATVHRDIAALRAFKDALRGLVLAEAALGSQTRVEYAEFVEELQSAVAAATYTPLSRPAGKLPGSAGDPEAEPLREILAASVLDARGLSFRAVALLGLAEGDFPRAEREEALLRESDRDMLCDQGLLIERRLRGDEVTFFYQAVTRARERLLLCRPYLAPDGQEWEASPYWEHVLHLCGKPRPRRVRAEEPPAPEEAASQAEFVQAGRQFDEHLARGVQVLRARLARAAAGAHDGAVPELSAALAGRYPAGHVWSTTRLEAYGTCPYFFFTAYALELEPREPPEEGYDAAVLGTMLHRILEEAFRRARDPADPEEVLDRLPQAAAQVFKTAPEDFGFRPTPLWDQEQQELKRDLEQTITAMAETAEGYAPRHFEQRFGFGEGERQLVLHTDAGEIRLHGVIDRLDEGSDGRLRVVDYKAGGAPITAGHLGEGRRLQLPIYALAARDALGLGEIAGGHYWHVRQAKPSSLKLEEYPGGVDAALEEAVAHVAAHVRSIRAGRFEPKPPADGCPSYCPAAGFCWRYAAGWR